MLGNLYNLGDRHQKGQISVADITKDYDEEEGAEAEERQRARVVALIAELKVRYERFMALRDEAAGTTKVARKPLDKEMETLKAEMGDLMIQIRLKDYQIAKIVDRLKELAKQVKKAKEEVKA